MKQNKQSICLAAPPLRQCVFLRYLLLSACLPACTIGEDGADNGPSGNRGEVVLLQTPFLYRSTVDPFCRERPGIVGSRNW